VTDTMLAGRLDLGTLEFRVREVPVPEPGPGEVLVQVAAAGVCLSDLHLIDGTLPLRRDGELTLGHEVAGTVAALGPGVELATGLRVCLQAGQVCGTCDRCVRRRTPCRRVLTRGVDYDGGWAGYALARVDTVVPIPDELPFEQAAIIPDAVSTPYAAVVHTGQVRPAQAVAVWGVGGLGAHAVRVLRLVGAAPIIAVDPLPGARQRALDFGADLALDPADAEFERIVRAATGGAGVHTAFDFAGVQAVRRQAMPVLAREGTLVLVGITPEAVDLGDGIRFGVAQHGVRGHYGSGAEAVEELIALAGYGRLDLAPSISGRIPLADAAEAVRRLAEKDGDPIRLILQP
jgi:D-arabinose 1-dehydrogenase-like Zn-dependent alcohol dehydrogenase